MLTQITDYFFSLLYTVFKDRVPFLLSIRKLPLDRFVRLACVRHAASVHPEPGSNSHVKVYIPVQNLAWLVLNRSTVVFRFCSECSHSWPITNGHFYKNFQGFTYCSVFKVRVVVFRDSHINISWRFAFVNNFFEKFFRISHAVSKDALCLIRLSLSLKDKAYLSTTVDKCQQLFAEIFLIVLTVCSIRSFYHFPSI